MKKGGFVRRFLMPCFSPTAGTTTTTTTTRNSITKFSEGNSSTAVTTTTTTTTTTKQRLPNTRTNSTTNKQNKRGSAGTHQKRNYADENEDEELSSSSSSMTDERVVLDYYPNNNIGNSNKYSLQKSPPRQQQLPPPPPPPPVPLKSVVTGTFYGHRRGHICFCIQKDRLNYSKPPLLLELSIPTEDLVKEMQRELVRIVLECDSSSNKSSCRLLSIPIWTMYINGRKVGFAARRRPTDKDRLILKTMQSTTVGAGVIPKELTTMASDYSHPHPHQGGGDGDHNGGGGGGDGDGDELIFMRANYRRVVGSIDTESFHLTNPDGCLSSQELSVFLMRSR